MPVAGVLARGRLTDGRSRAWRPASDLLENTLQVMKPLVRLGDEIARC
jgi:hypothetical protein